LKEQLPNVIHLALNDAFSDAPRQQVESFIASSVAPSVSSLEEESFANDCFLHPDRDCVLHSEDGDLRHSPLESLAGFDYDPNDFETDNACACDVGCGVAAAVSTSVNLQPDMLTAASSPEVFVSYATGSLVLLQILSRTTLNGHLGNVLGPAPNNRIVTFVPWEAQCMSLKEGCLRVLTCAEAEEYKDIRSKWKPHFSELFKEALCKFVAEGKQCISSPKVDELGGCLSDGKDNMQFLNSTPESFNSSASSASPKARSTFYKMA